MPIFGLNLVSTANANTGGVIQILMPSGRSARLLAVILGMPTATFTDIGRWMVSRIDAIGSTNFGSLTPFELDASGAASSLTDATKSIATACNGSGFTETAGSESFLEAMPGLNDLSNLNVRSGDGKGFLLQRTVAPSGSRTVNVQMIWEE